MSWLSKVFSKGSKSHTQLVLKFSKEDNNWQVMKGYSIMFIGSEQQCNTYMWNFTRK